MDDADSLKGRLRASLPDLPRWVETRDLLASEASSAIPNAARDGFVVWSGERGLGVVVGPPDPAGLAHAARSVPEILAFPENVEAVRAVLIEFAAEPATIFRAPAEEPSPPPHPCRRIGPDEIASLDHVAADLHEELSRAARHGRTVVAALDGGVPVAFAYVAAETEALWDVSIDTIPSHRRRGFASAAAIDLMRSMRRRGKTAVWGAAASNPASANLARRLGFVEVDALWVLARGSDGSNRA
jgi:GNAT superfamily N-acetyltransferase